MSGTFPALHILARLPDGNDLFFLFRDDDRSFVSSDALPTSYGSITDWDRIDLSVLLNPAMWPAPSSNPLDVSFSATSIPELSTTALVAFGTILGLSRRHRDYPKRQNKPSLAAAGVNVWYNGRYKSRGGKG